MLRYVCAEAAALAAIVLFVSTLLLWAAILDALVAGSK